ncbi:hypothetical protein EIP91_000762 [Steccherinum ochraceum]|uniref:F-box domain-containing protein n=1 Tax=Steccherinum ochraceum TaxID=92696 RepID=A0A4R0RJ95_9APHY|nr:hypothetical protein EIP91_000762 [Steccherinum ochraceum]
MANDEITHLSPPSNIALIPSEQFSYKPDVVIQWQATTWTFDQSRGPFPLELVSMTMEVVQDPKSLLACLAVCRAWYRLIARIHFRDVTLASQSAGKSQGILPKEDCASFVRRLHIQLVFPDEMGEATRAARVMTKVDELVVELSFSFARVSLVDVFPSQAVTITSLTLRKIRFDNFPNLARFIESCTKLRSLEIRGCRIESPSDVAAGSTCTGKLDLEVFKLSCTEPHIANVLCSWLLSGKRAPKLKVVDLDSPVEPTGEAPRYLRNIFACPSLQDLRLRVRGCAAGCRSTAQVLETDFRNNRCRTLRSVDIKMTVEVLEEQDADVLDIVKKILETVEQILHPLKVCLAVVPERFADILGGADFDFHTAMLQVMQEDETEIYQGMTFDLLGEGEF